MNAKRLHELRMIAQDLRICCLDMIQAAGSGHIGGSFSLAEIMAVLFFEKMNIRPEQPDWKDRDRFVMSKGHASPIMYAALAARGFFPAEKLKEFRKIDGDLSGHIEMRKVPGVDMSTGSLGQGISVALGMAVGAKLAGKDLRVYAVLGDGEMQEGQVWEALMYAGCHGIDNLITIIDYNKAQLEMDVGENFGCYGLAPRISSFGFDLLTIDGHDIADIAKAVDTAKQAVKKPVAILADTIKGKGVSFMEGLYKWHGKLPSEDEFIRAFGELKETKKEMEASQ